MIIHEEDDLRKERDGRQRTSNVVEVITIAGNAIGSIQSCIDVLGRDASTGVCLIHQCQNQEGKEILHRLDFVHANREDKCIRLKEWKDTSDKRLLNERSISMTVLIGPYKKASNPRNGSGGWGEE